MSNIKKKHKKVQRCAEHIFRLYICIYMSVCVCMYAVIS